MAKAKRKGKAKIDVSIGALSKAKTIYGERGDANSCGDWMAEALKVFRTENGDFDLTAFKACLKETKSERQRLIWTGTAQSVDFGCVLV